MTEVIGLDCGQNKTIIVFCQMMTDLAVK